MRGNFTYGLTKTRPPTLSVLDIASILMRGVANWIDIIYGAIFLREKLSQNFMILIWFDVEIWKGSCG